LNSSGYGSTFRGGGDARSDFMIRHVVEIGVSRVMRGLGRPSAPALMTYNVTHRCNARCSMCEIHGWESDPAAELTAAQYSKFIRDPQLKNIEVIRITGGEPFVRADIADIYRYSAEATQCSIFYVTTNGSFPERAAEFIESAASRGGRTKLHIQVSLDSMSDEHDRLRGVPGMREKAAETLRRLSELKKRHDFHAGINQTVMKSTLAEIEPVNEFARGLGLGHSLFVGAALHEGKTLDGVDPSVRAMGFESQDGMSAAEFDEFYEKHKLLKSVEKDAAASAFLRRVSEEYLNEGGRNRAVLGKQSPMPPCMAMFSHFRMLPDGKIVSCSAFRSTPAGSVSESSFSDIWLGDRADELRRKVLRCKGCWIECDINPSVFYSGDIIGWFVKKVMTDSGFRKRYL